MDSALIRLLMLRLRGGLRQRLIQLTSLRGVLFFVAFGAIIWLLIITNSSSNELGISNDTRLDRQAFSSQIRIFMPLGMLGMSLLTVVLTTGPTFHFSPAEINFLFTGPFRRRDLILYKLVLLAKVGAYEELDRSLAHFARIQPAESPYAPHYLRFLAIRSMFSACQRFA